MVSTTGQPTGARVQPMYFFFTPDRIPIFSRPLREKRDGTDWMKGGKRLLDPNPKDFCDGIDPGNRAECDERNATEKKKPYPARRRDLVADPLRGGSVDYQRPLVDTSPQDLGAGARQYTGFWEIVEVIVPKDYAPDTIKSVATLEKALATKRYLKRHTGKVIDCPILDERTYVAPGVSDRKIFRPLIELWYRRRMTFCFLAHGWETLGDESGQPYFANEDANRVDTFDVARVKLGQGKAETTDLIVPIGKAYVPTVVTDPQSGEAPTLTRVADNLLSRARPRHAQDDPPGYTPLRWMHDFEVPPEFQSGTLKTLANVDLAKAQPRRLTPGGRPLVKNVATRGTLIPCSLPKIVDTVRHTEKCGVMKDDPNTPGKQIIDPSGDTACTPHGLECNRDTCFCDVPFRGFGERCGPGIARCSADKGPLSENGFVCFPPWGGYCHLRCGGPNTRSEENLGKEPIEQVDSRCTGVPGYLCFGRRYCLKVCSENVSDPKQCGATVDVMSKEGMPPEAVDVNDGMTCQDWGINICTWPEGYTPK
jgi:hypothetical protein